MSNPIVDEWRRQERLADQFAAAIRPVFDSQDEQAALTLNPENNDDTEETR